MAIDQSIFHSVRESRRSCTGKDLPVPESECAHRQSADIVKKKLHKCALIGCSASQIYGNVIISQVTISNNLDIIRECGAMGRRGGVERSSNTYETVDASDSYSNRVIRRAPTGTRTRDASRLLRSRATEDGVVYLAS